MSDWTFGDHVKVTAVVGRLRRFIESAYDSDPWLGRVRLDLGHGRRAHADQYRDDSDFDDLDVLSDASTPRRSAHTLVHLVRVPVQRVRSWNAPMFDTTKYATSDDPMRGVVIGTTRRQSGVVTSDYEIGNVWTNHGAISVVTVAVETDGTAQVYDVHPDDIAEVEA